MRKNNAVALEVPEIESVNNWQSVLVEGTYEELSDGDAKAQLHDFSLGVKDLIIKKERRDLHFISEFSSKIYNEEIPVVFVIRIEGISGKKRRT
jgi:nitroimidazol reductase NimA-like FMN-containing flavoprotein (pyridoxamine 5'-phosphate oxidase superfamily)